MIYKKSYKLITVGGVYENRNISKKVRLEKKITLNNLSILSGISKGKLSRIERNEREPKISTLITIAEALKVDIKELYKVIR